LEPVGFRQCKALPLTVLRRAWIVIYDEQIEGTLEAGDKLPSVLIAMNAAEGVLAGHGDVVLLEVDIDASFPIDVLIVDLDIMSAKIFKYSGRFDQFDLLKFRVINFQLHKLFNCAEVYFSPEDSVKHLTVNCS